MKQFKCYKCQKYLGEMLKGKIRKNSIILCQDCYDIISPAKSYDLPDCMKDLFGHKK